MIRDLAVEQHSTQKRLVLNHLYRANPASTPVIHQKDAQHALHCLCLVSEPTLYFPLMSALHNLRSCSPLKTVFYKLRDTYQAYCNTYNAHTMAICHGGVGQPLDRDTAQHGQDNDIPNNYHHEDMDNFENTEQGNHTNLPTLIQGLNDLCHRVLAGEGQPTEAIHHIEHELHRLSLALHPSALPEPLDDVLQQYTETLCSTQKQTTFANTPILDIPTFSGSSFTQLEDWLVDIETADDLTDESRTKLAQAKSKGLTEAFALGKCWEDIKDLLFKNLQLRHPHFSELLYGDSTEGEGIFSSLHTYI